MFVTFSWTWFLFQWWSRRISSWLSKNITKWNILCFPLVQNWIRKLVQIFCSNRMQITVPTAIWDTFLHLKPIYFLKVILHVFLRIIPNTVKKKYVYLPGISNTYTCSDFHRSLSIWAIYEVLFHFNNCTPDRFIESTEKPHSQIKQLFSRLERKGQKVLFITLSM